MQREIGEGGMAELWLVQHRVLGSVHALKVLKPECARRVRIRNRFIAEGRVQAQLRHRHIVAVTDVVADEGFAALVMDYIAGGTLGQRLFDATSNLSPREASRVLLPLLDALEFAHGKGVVHRDLKPDNILFRDESWDEPVISDFGIAKLTSDADIAGTRAAPTRTGVTMGTPGYMAPEQIRGAHTVGPSADVFSMGVIAWELLTGAPPFAGGTEYEVMNRIVQGQRRPLEEVGAELPEPVREVIERSVATLADERYPSCRAFADALREAVAQSGDLADTRVPFDELQRRVLFGGDPESYAGATLAPEPEHPTLLPSADEPDDEPSVRRVRSRYGSRTDDPDAPRPSSIRKGRADRQSGPRTGLDDPRPSALRKARAEHPGGPVEELEAPPPLRKLPASKTGPSQSRARRRAALAGAIVLLLAVVAVSLVASGTITPATLGLTRHRATDGPYRGVGGQSLREARYELLEVPAKSGVTLGSPATERGRDADEALVLADLGRFALGTTEVSQGLWTEVMGSNPVETETHDWGGKVSIGSECKRFGVAPELPVTCVRWIDVIGFLNELSRRDGLRPAYEQEGDTVRWVRGSTGYRLPTELEFEAAARAGSAAAHGPAQRANQLCNQANVPGGLTSFWYSDFDIAETAPCSDGFTAVAPVGSFEANEWGMHDLIGNVAEWTWDPYDPKGPAASPATQRPLRATSVVRGGAWQSSLPQLRAADREPANPLERSWVVGFRIARSL